MTADPQYAAILLNPNDDAARESWAEALAQRGEADRARFVRLQVEDARLPAEGAAWEKRQAAILALLNAHPEWGEGFPAIDGLRWGQGQMLGFRRGCMASVGIQGAAFEAALGEAVRHAPITHVQVEAATDAHARAIGASPLVARLRWLFFYDCQGLTGAGVEAIAASPHVSRLDKLAFHRCEVGANGAAALVASPALGASVELQVTGTRLDKATQGLLRRRFRVIKL